MSLSIFHIGKHILKSTIDSVRNTILVQLGSGTEDRADGDGEEWYQHVGFASRPALAEGGKIGAECVGIQTGERDVIFASRDLRDQNIYGNLKDGETCIYATGPDGKGQGRVLLKKDGSVTLMTTHNNLAGGIAVALQIAPDHFSFAAPWGSLIFDATGFHLKTAAGPRLDMGGISLPGPLSQLGGYATLKAPVVTADGSIVRLGPGPAYATVATMPLGATAPIAGLVIPGSLLPGGAVQVSLT